MSSAAEFSKELASCNTLHFNSWWLNTSRNRQYIQIHRCFYWEDNLSLNQNISRSDSELIILTTLLLCLTRVKGAKYGTNAGVHCSPLPDTYSMCLLPWAGMKKLRRLFESYPWATKAPKLTQLCSYQDTHKAFCCIIHESQLEALLILEAFCEGVSHVVWREGFFSAVLELWEDCLGRSAMFT